MTSSACEPSATTPVQTPAQVNGVPPSREQVTVASGSSTEKATVAVLARDQAEGPASIDSAGAVLSTVHVTVLTGPAPSALTPRRATLWAPSVRPARCSGLEQADQAPPSTAHSVLVAPGTS